MRTLTKKNRFPDLYSKPTALQFAELWDSAAVARLIQNTETGKTGPSFLYLGQKEAKLLRQHFAIAYGEEAVTTLNETYYMGLKIVEVDADEYINTGGSKIVRNKWKAPSFQQAS
ncbi:MAG: hypothetical protein AB8D78_06790 [Akkermansiaceae bacterium]